MKKINPAFLHQALFALFGLAELCGDNYEAQVDHEKRTDDDEQNEVDEAEKGMRVHHIVHDVHPSLQGDYL